MEFNIRCIVLFANPYSFTNDEGEILKGVSIQYLTSDKLLPTSDKETKGMRIGSCSLPLEAMQKITEAPAIYEMSFSAQANSKGQMQMRPKDLKFVSGFGQVK